MPNIELEGEPGTGVAEDIVGRLIPEWWRKFQPKNAAYGGALVVGGGLGIKAFIPEINRKVQGIINEIWHDQVRRDGTEGAREKAMDLIGHLLILISNLDAAQDSGPRKGFDNAAIVDRAIGAGRAARLSGGDGKAAGVAKVDELAEHIKPVFADRAKELTKKYGEAMRAVTASVSKGNPNAEPVDTSGTFMTVGMKDPDSGQTQAKAGHQNFPDGGRKRCPQYHIDPHHAGGDSHWWRFTDFDGQAIGSAYWCQG